jgi:quinoprotein glucose dehydrogenase
MPAPSMCRSKIPPTTIMAAVVPATTCSATRIVALDLNTGKMKWYFQVVHHPIWDSTCPRRRCWLTSMSTASRSRRWPCPPSRLPLYLRPHHRQAGVADHREAGAAIRCAGRRNLQDPALPDQARALCRQQVTTDDLIDYTPEMRAQAQDIVKKYYKMSPNVGPAGGQQSQWRLPVGHHGIGNAGGGTNWPGAGFNPETQVVFAPAGNDVRPCRAWCRCRKACPI